MNGGIAPLNHIDMEDKTILKKSTGHCRLPTGGFGWLNTYYIYDDGDNLRYVIQPKGTDYLKAGNLDV